MRIFCLMIARFALSAWIGAAVLFVVTGVQEVRHDFDSTIRDALAALRFPMYYYFGFTLTGIALLSTTVAALLTPKCRRRLGISAGLVLVAMSMMVVDYIWIFQPLHEIVTAASSVKPAGFQTLHERSKHINMIDLTICLVAAITLCWPIRSDTLTD
jgi:hypothetical protein